MGVCVNLSATSASDELSKAKTTVQKRSKASTEETVLCRDHLVGRYTAAGTWGCAAESWLGALVSSSHDSAGNVVRETLNPYYCSFVSVPCEIETVSVLFAHGLASWPPMLCRREVDRSAPVSFYSQFLG